MKSFQHSSKFFIPAVLFAVLISTTAFAQSDSAKESSGINWMKFDEGVAKAKSENKIVLIHFYTKWCRWCKEMDKQVFADKKVKDYVNENFVAVRCDAEAEERITFKDRHFTLRELSFAMAITSYPTTLFLTADFVPITRLPGYIPASLYIDVVEYINMGAYKNMKFEEWQKKKVK